jgi:DNA-directed RNA polymerase specialized sigma24 family protein
MSEEIIVAKKKKSVQYFTKETENAIVRYNNTEDSDERSLIYRNEIHYAFFKLTENIIHTFKFYYTEVENIEDLQHEVITFLLSKIHRFNPENGAKAYSYFGTIAKRWLILYNQKNYKKRIDAVDIEVIEEDETFSYELEDSQPIERLSYYIDEYVDYCTENIFKLFPKEDDAKIADAVLELFRKREHLDIFNKKALYIYIREIVDAKTPKITKVTTKLYDIFKHGYSFYLEHEYVKFDL